MSGETELSEALGAAIAAPAVPSIDAAGAWAGFWRRFSPYWTLTVVSLFSISAAIDSGQLPLLVNQVSADLRLTDVQIGFIQGFGSTMMTSIGLIPAGYLADRFSRRLVLALSAVVWSLSASLTGFANGFWSLFGTRAGVSAAEAPLNPAAHCILRDSFPPARRGLPFGVYWAAQAVGTSVSLFIGGALLASAEQGAFKGWPLIGGFKAWQIVLAAPGLCTLPLVFLMFTVKEPPMVHVSGVQAEKVTFGQFLRYARENWSLFWPSYGYCICWALQYWGVLSWQPAALERGWGIPTSQLAEVTGAIGMPGALGGLLIGGWLVDVLGKRGMGDGAAKVCLVFSIFSAVFQIAVFYVGRPWMVFTCIGLSIFFFGAINATYYVAVAYITPGRLTGRMMALQFLCLYPAYAVSPVIIAFLEDKVFAGQGPLAIVSAIKAVLIVCSAAYIAFLWLWTLRVTRWCKANPGGAL